MREILFRGKNAYDLYWVYGYCVKQGKETYIFEQEEVDMGIDIGGYLDCCRLTEVVPETVGQYTGLTDKNGTKIFEGDIVEADNGHISEVVFWNGMFCLLCRCHGTHNRLWNDDVIEIGNIHDNPELLERGDQSEAH